MNSTEKSTCTHEDVPAMLSDYFRVLFPGHECLETSRSLESARLTSTTATLTYRLTMEAAALVTMIRPDIRYAMVWELYSDDGAASVRWVFDECRLSYRVSVSVAKHEEVKAIVTVRFKSITSV